MRDRTDAAAPAPDPSASAEPVMEPVHRPLAAWAGAGLPREDLWDLPIGASRTPAPEPAGSGSGDGDGAEAKAEAGA
ncbi:hypothetical protein [Streptomyces virginiae]|uniref:Uncharacterized protein n=1 Tax=Streptomyces virginiae TaxID=1961 RepID=A0ABZ1T7V8_STRVG|nr:hypothetical protein [Streptomyces virginiae]WTB21526.1 hypothetical protein OG253_08525 [Streptomyces virginiae]